MPDTAASKLGGISRARSSHDSQPTCLHVVAHHHGPLKCRCPLRAANLRTGRPHSKGTDHASLGRIDSPTAPGVIQMTSTSSAPKPWYLQIDPPLEDEVSIRLNSAPPE